MKKAILFAQLTILTFFSYAQDAFGPKIGMGISNYRYKVKEGEAPETKPAVAPVAGLCVNMQLGDYFSVQPALQYALLGAGSGEDTLTNMTTRTATHNIQIPVLFKIRYPFTENFSAGLGAGPYVGYMFDGALIGSPGQGKIKGKSKVKPEEMEEEVTYMNPWDYGITFAPFVEINMFQIAFNYNIGLSDLTTEIEGTDIETKFYNRWIGISFAYLFREQNN